MRDRMHMMRNATLDVLTAEQSPKAVGKFIAPWRAPLCQFVFVGYGPVILICVATTRCGWPFRLIGEWPHPGRP